MPGPAPPGTGPGTGARPADPHRPTRRPPAPQLKEPAIHPTTAPAATDVTITRDPGDGTRARCNDPLARALLLRAGFTEDWGTYSGIRLPFDLSGYRQDAIVADAVAMLTTAHFTVTSPPPLNREDGSEPLPDYPFGPGRHDRARCP